MPKFRVELTDGRAYAVEAANEDDARRDAIQYATYEEAERAKRPGFLASTGEGLEGATVGGVRGIQQLLQPENRALEQTILEQGGGPQYSWEDVENAFSRGQYGEAAGELWGLGKQTAGGTLGTLAPGIAAGRTAFALAPPVLPGIGPLSKPIAGAIGFASGMLPGYIGSNVEQQVVQRELARRKGEPVPEFEAGKALAAAGGQTLLDMVTLRAAGLQRLAGLGRHEAMIAARKELEALGGERFVASMLKGTGRTAIAEMPTEVGQTALERWQAGMPLSGDDAAKAYKEAVAGAAILSPLFGIPGRRMEVSGARKELAELQEKEAQQQQKQEARAKAAEDAMQVTRQMGLPGMEDSPEQVEVRADSIARSVMEEAKERGVEPRQVELERQRASKARIASLGVARDKLIAQGRLDEAGRLQEEITNETKNLRGYGGFTLAGEEALENKIANTKKKLEAANEALRKAETKEQIEKATSNVKSLQEKLGALQISLERGETNKVPKQQMAFDFEAPMPEPKKVTPAKQAEAPFELTPSGPETIVEYATPKPTVITRDTLTEWFGPELSAKAWKSPVVRQLVGLDLAIPEQQRKARELLTKIKTGSRVEGLSTRAEGVSVPEQMEIPIEPILAQQMMEERQQAEADKARADARAEKFKSPKKRAEEERTRAAREEGRWAEPDQERAAQEEQMFAEHERQTFEEQPVGYQREFGFGARPAQAEAPAQPTIDEMLAQLTAARAAKDADAVADVEEMARQLYPDQWTQAKYNNLSRRQTKLDFGAKVEEQPVSGATEEGQGAAAERPAGEPSVGMAGQPEAGVPAEGPAPSGDRGLGGVGAPAETGAEVTAPQRGTLTEEKPDAVQEPSPTEVPARKRAEAGKRVGEEVPREEPAAEEAQAKVEEKVDPANLVADLNEISKREKNSDKGKRARRYLKEAKQGRVADLPAAQAFVEDNKPVEAKKPAEAEKPVGAEKTVEDYEAKLAAENAKDEPNQHLVEAYEKRIAVLRGTRAPLSSAQDTAWAAEARAAEDTETEGTETEGTETEARAAEGTELEDGALGERVDVAGQADRGDVIGKEEGPEGSMARKGEGKKPRYTSAVELVNDLAKEFGKPFIAALKAGRVRIYESESDPRMSERDRRIVAKLKADGEEAVSGYYDPTSDSVVLFAQNTARGQGVQAAVHEAGVHAGWKAILGDAAYNDVMGQIDRALADNGRTDGFAVAVRAADEAARALAAKEEHIPEERLAYLSEKYPQLPLVRRLVAAVRNWLRKHGVALDYTEADVAVLARGIARKWMQQGGVKREGAATAKARKQAAAQPAPTAAKQSALDAVVAVGRSVAPPEKETHAQKAERWMSAAKEMTPEKAMSAYTTHADKVRTKIFSSNTALMAAFRRNMDAAGKDTKEVIGTMIAMSDSQALHDEAVAHQFLILGDAKFDPETSKYVGTESKHNFVNLHNEVDKIAAKYGFSETEMDAVLQTAFEARRIGEIRKSQEQARKDAEALRYNADALLNDRSGTERDRAKRRDKAKTLKKMVKKMEAESKRVTLHMDETQVRNAMSLFDTVPELDNVAKQWDGIRKSAIKLLTETNVYSKEQAESYLDSVGYVPFYRDEESFSNSGGADNILRSLQVQKEKRMHGSKLPVHNIVDNMARWTQLAVSRGIRNAQAIRMVDFAKNEMPEGFVKLVGGASDSTARILRDGRYEYYEFEDPLFADAFKGLEQFGVQWPKFAVGASNFLRQSVVLNPMFSVGQVAQDAFGAMFTSGLSWQNALKVPMRSAREFVRTIRGTSKLNQELRKYGVVGVADYSAAVTRADAEVIAGIKKLTRGQNVMRWLQRVAMASDNAIRQTVYELALEQGFTKAEALEKAFEIINFRRAGTSAKIRAAAQVIPFTNAYFQAMNVAYKTVTGEGISPSVRRDALKNLAQVTGMVMALSLLYSLMVGDDDDYQNTDVAVRNRLLMIPGTGLGIPLRPDIFLLPKVATEMAVQYISGKGSMDGTKYRKAMADAVWNSVLGPTPVPQFAKPFVEIALNRNFYTGRDIIGTYMKKLETERQYTAATSELGKWIGSSGLIAPVNADHLLRGVAGSVGGLMMWASNAITSGRPSQSEWDSMASLPGFGAFMRKEYGTGLKGDFYELRSAVDEVVSTYNDLLNRDPQRANEYVMDPERIKLYGMQSTVNQINKYLSDIREAINFVSEDPSMTAQQKADRIRELRETELRLMRNVDVGNLRRRAGL